MKKIRVIGNIAALSISLIGMAWSYGEVKKMEGRAEATKEFEMQLLNLKMDLENDYRKRREGA